MNNNEYRIIDDFQVQSKRVLILDRDYEFNGFKRAEINGKIFSYTLCSIRNWIIIDSDKIFKGNLVIFK